MAIKIEKENNDEAKNNLKNLFYAIEEFISAGSVELKPIGTNINTNIFKIEGFKVPQPIGKGRTLRNIHAFQCILNLFNKAQTYDLCYHVLNSIRNIYQKDECNYFILESQNILLYSLDDSSLKIHNRTNEIQQKFIEILEFIVFNLKFVPCKELISIGLSIQNYNCTKWSINCASFLLKLVKVDPVYKDAFRELGLLEMTVSCLHKFASLLKEKYVDDDSDLSQNENVNIIDQNQKELGFLIMDIVTCLLSQNSANAKVFRELGGARLAHNMVPYKLCRQQALNIVSTLLLSTTGEDDMSTLLGLMHTAKIADLNLKNSILRSLLFTLRESHRTRTVFRKAGGFVYVLSVLISMEGSLKIPATPPWDKVKINEVFTILKTILTIITVSMRYEPANANFFESEVRWKSLYSALKLIGCFDTTKTEFDKVKEKSVNSFVLKKHDDNDLSFEDFFCMLEENYFLYRQNEDDTDMDDDEKTNNIVNLNTCNINNSSFDSMNETKKFIKKFEMEDRLVFNCFILRFLFDTAIDSFDK
jgi:WD repeat and FYVE domain-containing protein 3